MANVDLHVHSRYSAHPSEWFLQRLGTRESYTDPEDVFREAQSRDMSFVTITDHNEIEGSLLLKEKYPDRVFTGVEVTTYFPENGCKVHVLVYGLTHRQFETINAVRSDIYDFRSYLKQEQLAHSVAHATFSINKKLTIELLEKLFLSFDYFEVINGSRSRIANDVLYDALMSLTPDTIDSLYSTYRIEPFSDTPWIKGLTGGTDDHSGLFIGKTFTSADAETPESFLQQLRDKQSVPGGRHNDYQGLAFSLYKIAYDFSQTRSSVLSSSLFSTINRLVFDRQSIGLKNRLLLNKMKYSPGSRGDCIQGLIVQLIETFQKNPGLAIEDKMDLAYDKISDIADHLFRMFVVGLERELQQGDIVGIVRLISESIPGIFLSLPFFTTIELLNESRELIDELSRTYCRSRRLRRQRIACITDNMKYVPDMQDIAVDVNGCERADQVDIIAFGCFSEGNFAETGECQRRLLPAACSVSYSFFPSQNLYVPSLLKSLKMICTSDPDGIIISPAGPSALLGVLAARLLHVRCIALYDAAAVDAFVSDCENNEFSAFVQNAIRWMYSFADTIVVTDRSAVTKLTMQGYNPEKIIFCRKSFVDVEHEQDTLVSTIM